jgi:hypothetical protein
LNTQLKVKYNQDFKKISSLVNEFDLYGLIKGGASIGEYDCLTDIIISSYYRKKSKDEIKVIILKELVNHFGTPNEIYLEEPHKTEISHILDNLLNRIDKSISQQLNNTKA